MEENETLKALRKEIILLASGQLPEGIAYVDETGEISDDPADQEIFRVQLLMARASMLVSLLTGMPPSVVAGEVAGMLLASELEVFMEEQRKNEIIRQTAKQSAQWN